MSSILMVLTGATIWNLNDGTKHPTGFWAEEFVVPHGIFSEAGVDITIATPGGVTPVADELSLAPAMNQNDEEKIAELRSYLARSKSVLEAAVPLESVDPDTFDAVFVSGGHGPMEDLAVNTSIGRTLVRMLDDSTKTVASVCHGQASFSTATRADGQWAFKGRSITAFLDEEERQAGFADKAPWLLEKRLRDNGALFDAGPVWAPHIVIDGNLVTGQNPASAGEAANAVLQQLKERATR